MHISFVNYIFPFSQKIIKKNVKETGEKKVREICVWAEEKMNV
jgi:hypothetical protein